MQRAPLAAWQWHAASMAARFPRGNVRILKRNAKHVPAKGHQSILQAADTLEAIRAQSLRKLSRALLSRDALLHAQQVTGKQCLHARNGCLELSNAFGPVVRSDKIGIAKLLHCVHIPEVEADLLQTNRVDAGILALASAHSTLP